MSEKLVRFEQVMGEEIQRNETVRTNMYYGAKTLSVKLMQDMGTDDATIEKALGIKLRPEDRKKVE